MLEQYSISMAKKKDSDFSVRAFRVVEQATQKDNVVVEPCLVDEGKNPNAVALGRLGGLKGGKARFAKLTPEERKKIAQRAAKARWGKK
jgi:hypothetical protein